MRTILVSGLWLGLTASLAAQDWQPLFNGKDLTGWMNAAGQAPNSGWQVQDGVLVRTKAAGDIWTQKRYADFILELEFQTTGNSGIFIRTDNPRDNVQTGIEIQVDTPRGKPTVHSVGAVYDCVAPRKIVARPNAWNKVVILAKDQQLQVTMNGEAIVDMDLNRWTEANRNPDGSKNKFRTPLKDFKREGHIGFQDHGAKVMYRNVRMKMLKD